MMKFRAPRSRGFTLAEMMIVVSIMGILAALAYPSYLDSIRKARRGEGKAAITRILQAEERYYTANNVYLAFSSTAVSLPAGFLTYSGNSSAASAYAVSAGDCGATALQCIAITATATQTDPLCGTLSMRSDGVRSSTASGSTVATNGCW